MEENNNLLSSKPKYSISSMYKEWFLDYASYVILERAVPHIQDGLKPVQRRILHAMKQLDDGRYNKVANIIGHTMQYHPHGDASIGDALVQLGQKDLLIDTQGNWGNVFTGDSAAAARYIEARLSKFALDVVFNPKTTNWKLSYDGRNKEPVCLPVKFPMLLAQGMEGIAVGLASKIFPHNFVELIDASVKHLQNEDFEIYPDFIGGGMIDVSKYNNGLRGGRLRVRAKINKIDKNTLSITELPFGKTTSSIIESILSANEKNKIKIKKIDDNTSDKVEIIIQLQNGSSPDITIDALYAFTDCEISLSPNSCVIENNKPRFAGVKELLKESAEQSRELLKQEQLIKLSELNEAWHLSSLEKIFIENRIYISIEECETWEGIIQTIDEELTPFKKLLKREVTRDDIIKLTEIKIKRISKYDAFKAEEHIRSIEKQIEEIKHNIEHITDFTIAYYKRIKEKHGKGRERKTEIRSFDVIEAAQVAVANQKLYANYKEGFVGTGMKKDTYICDCSDIDEIIVFRKDGTYVISKVSEKAFLGKNIIHVNVYKRNDERTIYNVIYKDGRAGNYMVKRFRVNGITRDKEYNLTKGTEHSLIVYFTENSNGEAETIRIVHKPKKRLRKHAFEFDFSTVDIKGRQAYGNIITRNEIHKISVKEKGTSTLGGQNIWFDPIVMKLNTEERGEFIGEFEGDDKLLVFTKNGEFYLQALDLLVRFEDDLHLIKKYDKDEIFALSFFDADKNYNNYYLKRFKVDENSTLNRKYKLIGENEDSKFIELTNDKAPLLNVKFGGENSGREDEIIKVNEFIGEKSYKAHGKRISIYEIESIKFIKNPKSEQTEEEKEKTQNIPVKVESNGQILLNLDIDK